MANMYSVGELIDKLIIENIKIFRLRETLHSPSIDDTTYVMNDHKMNTINENRAVIIKFLDKKIKDVTDGKPNSYFKDVKTYAHEIKESK